MEGIDAGADDYLVKPFSARELLSRVGTTTQLAQLRQWLDALRASEAKFRTLFDTIDEGLAIQEMVYDEQGNLVDVI